MKNIEDYMKNISKKKLSKLLKTELENWLIAKDYQGLSEIYKDRIDLSKHNLLCEQRKCLEIARQMNYIVCYSFISVRMIKEINALARTYVYIRQNL